MAPRRSAGPHLLLCVSALAPGRAAPPQGIVGYKTGTQVLGYVVFAEGFGQTGGIGGFRQGYAAAASVVLFILVMIFGLSANWFVNRRERKYLG